MFSLFSMFSMFSGVEATRAMIVAVLALSGGSPERLPVPEAAMIETTPCVSMLGGNKLDLEISKDATDIRSLDANTSILSSSGAVSLWVAAASGSTIPISVRFAATTDSVSIRGPDGTGVVLNPPTSLEPVTTLFTIVGDGNITITASSDSSTRERNPATSNKAVLKPVTSCPRG
jgi:hypothetical protein